LLSQLSFAWSVYAGVTAEATRGLSANPWRTWERGSRQPRDAVGPATRPWTIWCRGDDGNVRQTAIAAFERAKPHVLVSDIAMPGEHGYSLIQTVRALPPEQGGQVPAIALTAYVRPEDRDRVLAAGYTRHLAKPIDPVDLASAVARLATGA